MTIQHPTFPRTPVTPSQQKFVIMSSQTRASNTQSQPISMSPQIRQSLPSSLGNTPTIVKVVSSNQSSGPRIQTTVPRTPTTSKIVVVSMSQGSIVGSGSSDLGIVSTPSAMDLGMKSVFSEQPVPPNLKQEPENG